MSISFLRCSTTCIEMMNSAGIARDSTSALRATVTSQDRANELESQNVKISSIGPGQTKSTVVRKSASQVSIVKKEAVRYSFAQKVQAITLITHKYNPQYVEFCTGVTPRAQLRIMATARKRGYDFLKDPRIQDAHVVEGRMTGRPRGSKDSKPRKSGPRKKRKDVVDDNIENVHDDLEVEDESSMEHAVTDHDVQIEGGSFDNQVQTSHFQSIALQLAGIKDYLSS